MPILIINTNSYLRMLKSNDDNIIKEALQKLFEECASGKHIRKSDKDELLGILLKLLNSQSPKVRRWAYHCACFFNNINIEKKIIKNLSFENNNENIIWALETLSSRYTGKEYIKLIKNLDKKNIIQQDITDNYLTISSSLFSKDNYFNNTINQNFINNIYEKGNESEILWTTKLLGYPVLSNTRSLNQYINSSHIVPYISSNNKIIQEYALWSLYFQADTSHYFQNIKDNIILPYSSLKWYYANAIKSQMHYKNNDFIVSVLRKACLDYHNQANVKEGILKGLSYINYNSNFVEPILEWFYHEEDIQILRLILTRMVNFVEEDNKENNCNYGNYYEAVSDAFINYKKKNKFIYNSIKDIIRNNKKTILFIRRDVKGNEFLDIKEGEKSMAEIIYNIGDINAPSNLGPNGQIIINEDKKSELLEILNQFKAENNFSELDTTVETVIKEVETPTKKSKEILTNFISTLPQIVTISTAVPKIYDMSINIINNIKSLLGL